MPRVGSGGRVTAVVQSHYLKKLIFISQQDCVAGAHTCLRRMTIKAPRCDDSSFSGHNDFQRLQSSSGSRFIAGAFGSPINVRFWHKADITILLQRHTFLGQFLFCFFVLGQMRQAHATQYIGCLSELNIVVTDDLHSVTQGSRKSRNGPSSRATSAAFSALRAASLSSTTRPK